MAFTLAPLPYQTVLDGNGDPISGALIQTYITGTTTPSPTYADADGNTENDNPIEADSAGRFVAYMAPGVTQKWVFKTAAGVTFDTVDPVGAVPASAANLDVIGVAGETLLAGKVVYLSDGSGSKTAGQWFLADADQTYSSTTPAIGMTPSEIASGQSGTIRRGGREEDLSGLTVGTTYYVSATAGGLTATAPANARVVGVADTTSSLILTVSDAAAAIVDTGIVEGRLTLTSNTPVTTADVTAATTVYFTPYGGNRIALYNGTSWNILTFSQLSIALGTDTTTLPYDVFAYISSSAVAIERLVWTNTTTRATALTTQDGVLVKTGATDRRYLGTYFTTAAGQTEDSYAKRMVWNYYNRVMRPTRIIGSGSWSYTTNGYRQANASTANQVEYVVGVAEVPITVMVCGAAGNATTGCGFRVAVGMDATNAAATGNLSTPGVGNGGDVNYLGGTTAVLRTFPAVGYHYFAWLERSTASGTTTWSGASDNTAAGISAEMMG